MLLDHSFYRCVITNTTSRELHPQNIAIGLLAGKSGNILEEVYQKVETLQSGETAILTYAPNAQWKFRQFMRITIMGEASEFFVTGHCSDPVIDSKVCPTRNHAAVFIERHAFSESITVAVAVVITAVPKLLSAETIDTTSGGYCLTFLGIELAWVIYGIPLLVYIGWNVIASMMESQASTMTAQGTMSGGSVNLTIYEGIPETVGFYREVMGVGKVSNHRKIFFFGFCFNAALIADQILHGVMKGESNIMSGIMSCSLFWSDKSMKVFFGAKSLIDTG